MDKIRKAEEDFRNNMSNSMAELEIEKKSIYYCKKQRNFLKISRFFNFVHGIY